MTSTDTKKSLLDLKAGDVVMIDKTGYEFISKRKGIGYVRSLQRNPMKATFKLRFALNTGVCEFDDGHFGKELWTVTIADSQQTYHWRHQGMLGRISSMLNDGLVSEQLTLQALHAIDSIIVDDLSNFRYDTTDLHKQPITARSSKK